MTTAEILIFSGTWLNIALNAGCLAYEVANHRAARRALRRLRDEIADLEGRVMTIEVARGRRFDEESAPEPPTLS